ncbi:MULTISPECIES: acyl-CoA dehydrogenase family protein [unclassified Sphingobium]|uniref:acyl-CoA dehydrogenase family protein n=1 Tax=unclassified Sphingobium TaxID=2611147 RepID=UPI0007701C74|nr:MULTISPECIES: acyl-CoA dehydrogenase family protein [Sphingomonadaceae]AMK24122.1 acyl-CoA dehydrogenase [Sphingobium sp. TKS]NML91988.1 acyl-CoA/acyl-ACP dehydrogenase [Sphingobium sp. TB-6]
MDLLLTEEQEGLQAAFSKGIANELPLERLQGDQRQAVDDASLRTFADLGWLRMSMPEEWGGLALSYAEEVLLFRELGRNLGPLSLLGGVLGARVAAVAGNTKLAETILSGEVAVGIALPEVSSGPESNGRVRVRLLSSGQCAMAVFVRPAKAELVDVASMAGEACPCLDDTLVMRSFDLDNAPLLARAGDPQIWWHGSLLAAAMLVGQAEGARDMILEYAKFRQTFGRPIGAYQAVRHPIAEMTARAEHARCQTYYASLALGMGRGDAPMQVAAARAIAQEAARKNADANIQLHGAVGITSEMNAHLFLKRGIVLSNMFGRKKAALHQVLNDQLMEV